MCPNVLNTEIDGRRGYATNDLMEEHPVHKEYMKVVGRKDDQIMLSTGEKVRNARANQRRDTTNYVLTDESWPYG